ncbi:MAG: hypothetical protein AB1757_12205 [Acidobacteriota bacterium]
MKKFLFPALAMVFALAVGASAHDPRTVAKEFSHSMKVEGAGTLTLTYKSMHWNEPAYLGFKKNDQLRERVVGSLWKKIGTLQTEFDVVISGVNVPKGTYDFGLWFDANDNFKIVLGAGGKDMKIDLTTVKDAALVNYLTFDFRPTDKADVFTIEGRGGNFRCTSEFQVPYLADHNHPAEKKN